MSFYCKICGLVEKGTKQQRVVTKVRNVKYLFRNIYVSRHIDSDTGTPKLIPSAPKVVKETAGWEIVEQDIYCPKCLPKNSKPKIVDNVVRYIDRTVYTREKRERLLTNRRRNSEQIRPSFK